MLPPHLSSEMRINSLVKVSNSPPPSTGELLVPSVRSRTRAHVDHAGPSQLLEHWKVQFSLEMAPYPHSPNKNSSIAPVVSMPTALIRAVMVALWMVPSCMSLKMESLQILPTPTRDLMEPVGKDSLLDIPYLDCSMSRLEVNLPLWLLLTSNP